MGKKSTKNNVSGGVNPNVFPMVACQALFTDIPSYLKLPSVFRLIVSMKIGITTIGGIYSKLLIMLIGRIIL
jgi:hypothetical protein